MITNENVNRGIDYILNHINENITVEDIANHCNFSRYYFSRMFKIETGEGVYEFIKRVKMEQSAFRLKIDRRRSITDISYDYGYSSSNYSTAFKRHHKLSPIKFRLGIMQKSLINPIYREVLTKLESLEECNNKISIKILEDYTAIYERHKGSYGDLSVVWKDFSEKYKEYVTEETLFFERNYDDPSITNIDECLYDIYMSAPKGCVLENICIIKGGKFGVYHFEGEVDKIYTAYQSIFNVWLPQSGFEVDERYGFIIYKKIDCEYMKIDICIPLK